jgi:hypothetical protein
LNELEHDDSAWIVANCRAVAETQRDLAAIEAEHCRDELAATYRRQADLADWCAEYVARRAGGSGANL